MKIARHILITAGILFLILGIPLIKTGAVSRIKNGADTVSSATVILDQPDGTYVIYLNQRMHPDKENLQSWIDFFSGREIGIMFEDISCGVASNDAAGIEMAQSLQSRLPENQMKVHVEDPSLLLSKAEYGRFDVLVLSKNIAEVFAADSLDRDKETVRITAKGA